MRQGRLAGPGRAPEDERGQLAALNHVSQNPPRAEEMRLPDEVVERLRAHALGERRGPPPLTRGDGAEEIRPGIAPLHSLVPYHIPSCGEYAGRDEPSWLRAKIPRVVATSWGFARPRTVL